MNTHGKTRIIVCGCRDFSDEALFARTVDEILPQYENIELISGHAKGADTFCETYAATHNIPVTIFKPDWKKYGRGAGPVRNREMLAYAVQETPILLAFWDGKSRGTNHMISLAKQFGAKCHVIYCNESRKGEVE